MPNRPTPQNVFDLLERWKVYKNIIHVYSYRVQPRSILFRECVFDQWRTFYPPPHHHPNQRPSQERNSGLVGPFIKTKENKHSFQYIILKVCIINEEEMCNLEVHPVLKWRFIEDGQLTLSACHFGLACRETWIWLGLALSLDSLVVWTK